jgi:hypothetical protein
MYGEFENPDEPDISVRISLRHKSNVEMSLLEYSQQADQHTTFHPLVIRTMTVPEFLKRRAWIQMTLMLV